MDTITKINDLRLKAFLKGLADNQVELRRLKVKIVKSQRTIKDKAFKAKTNTFDKEGTVLRNELSLRTLARERHYVRLEARAAHLTKMMIRGVPYLKVEQVVNPQTMEAERLMYEYFPGVMGKVTIDVLDQIRDWINQPAAVAAK
jgi:hypothetical protein